MDTIIQIIKKIIKKLFLQITWFVIIMIVINRIIVIILRSHLRFYGYTLASIVIFICLVVFPITYVWNIKNAIIQTIWSYLITKKQDAIIQRVVENYTTHIAKNQWISNKLTIIKNINNAFPTIIQRIVNRMIDEIPIMSEIIDVIKDFNPINMSHEDITINLSLKIQEKIAHSNFWNITIRDTYNTIFICNICIWLVILGQIYYTSFYTSL